MKGVVFVALGEMIQDKFGHRLWNEIIDDSRVESGGVYTTAENYKDEEALALLETISAKLKKEKADILKLFGIFLIKYFEKKTPHFFENKSFDSFLDSIDTVVHIEIKKLSPENIPPQIIAEKINNKSTRVFYKSKRKLCSLAIGLIKGASHIYGENIEVDHVHCMHNGFDRCEFLITKK